LTFDYSLGIASTVSGTVKTSSGIVVEGSYVIITGENEKNVFLSSVDEDGSYLFADLSSGTYSVAVYSSSGILNQKDTWTITTGQNVTGKNYVWATWSGISGTVKDANGNAIVGIEVILQNDDDVFLVAKTNASGTYFFATLLPGNYTLSIMPAGVTQEVTIDTDQTSITKDLTLAYTATVTGELVGSNVSILIFKGNDYVGSIVTDENGWFNIHLLDTGIYNFYAYSAYTIYTSQTNVNVTPGSKITLNMAGGSHKATITATGSFDSKQNVYYSIYRLVSNDYAIEVLHGRSETGTFDITGLIASGQVKGFVGQS